MAHLPAIYPIVIDLPGLRLEFDWEAAEWRQFSDVQEELLADPEEVTGLRRKVHEVAARNEALLDSLTVKELDLKAAKQLRKEIEDLVGPK